MQVYLDGASTTRPYKDVVDVMYDVAYNHWGNPSSNHSLGDDARQIIETVRNQIAEDINASPEEIIFTSGACEANALAIKGFLDKHSGARWWTSRIEHSSIDKLATRYAPKALFFSNDNLGFVEIQPIFIENTRSFKQPWLASVTAANGEIGTIQDIKKISNCIHNLGGVLHTDATQLFAERRIDVQALGMDMMSVSAQKFHGPRGSGFLYVKNGIELKPLIYGTQENELRGGTYNTAAIAGMGKALELVRKHNSSEHVQKLRDRLLSKLTQIDGVRLNGAPAGPSRLKNNISIVIDGVSAERLVAICSLHGIYISKSSACNSFNPEPSRTLQALQMSNEDMFNTVRLTLDEFNTEEEIDYAADIITKLIARIRDDEEQME